MARLRSPALSTRDVAGEAEEQLISSHPRALPFCLYAAPARQRTIAVAGERDQLPPFLPFLTTDRCTHLTGGRSGSAQRAGWSPPYSAPRAPPLWGRRMRAHTPSPARTTAPLSGSMCRRPSTRGRSLPITSTPFWTLVWPN